MELIRVVVPARCRTTDSQLDVESMKRVYSVESSTAHGATNYEIIMAESRAIVSRLKKDRLIR